MGVYCCGPNVTMQDKGGVIINRSCADEARGAGHGLQDERELCGGQKVAE